MAQTVFATYVGNGRLEARGPADEEQLDRNYVIGNTVRLTVTNPRSQKQLNFFFLWLAAVYDNLPEDCPEHFKDAEHLRAWMLYRAGFCEVWSHPRADFSTETVRMLRRISKKHLFFEYNDTMIFIFEPHSIALTAAMTRSEFNQFFDKAKELALHLIPGLDLDALEANTQGGPAP